MRIARFHPRALAIVLAGLCLSWTPLTAGAQGARLTGRILDSLGAPIAGAGVRIPSLERGATTDSAGRYVIDSLPTRRLTVVGEAPGYFGRRVEVTVPSTGTVEQSFALVPNAHVLATVDVRARMHERLPDKLAEFASRRNKALGRFMGPSDVAKFNGHPLTDALKTILNGARIAQVGGTTTIVSSRSMNLPSSLRQSTNVKPCGVQVWQDGMLMADPQSSADLMQPTDINNRKIATMHVGADRDFDLTGILADSYMAVEYYPDLPSTPPGLRSGTASCGVLVLWTRVPMPGEGKAGESKSGDNKTGENKS